MEQPRKKQGISAGELARGLHPLTRREREVLGHMLSARGAKATAREMGVAVSTAEKLRSRVFDKLNVENAIQAMIKMVQLQGRAMPTPDDLVRLSELQAAPQLTARERCLLDIVIRLIPVPLDLALPAFDELTQRENELLALLMQGAPTRSMAERLGISPRTVEAHRANILRKLGVRDRFHLTRFVLEAACTQAKLTVPLEASSGASKRSHGNRQGA